MSDTYHFNPFSLVTQVNNEIHINTYPPNRVTFSSDCLPIIKYFLSKEKLNKSEVLKCIARTRLEELVDKKVLLKGGAPSVEGRYSRQMGYFSMISDTPEALHQKLQESHALILGAGAIGSHTCWNLAAIGVGKITLVDFDQVEESNLNRQLMYTPEDIGKYKVDVLGDKIRAFNPGIQVVSVNEKIASIGDIEKLVGGVDIVVKAIDTPEESMDWVNRTCVKRGIPYISGGFLDSTAVVGPNYLPGKSSCFACQGDSGNVRRLHGTGPTFGPLTTLVTSMLSMLAFKILVGQADGYADRIYVYNAGNGTWDSQLAAPTKACSVCGSEPPPASEHAEAEKQKQQLTTLRGLFVAMLTLTVILGQIFEQPLVGVLAFFGFFACIPVVNSIYENDPLRSRREFFVLTCIYMGFSLVGRFIEALYAEDFSWPGSLREMFDVLQVVSATVIQAAIGITIMFLLLCAVREYAPKLVNYLNQDL